MCAEPSPDTFSVYSAALDANAAKADQLTAALKATTSESGGAIGIRSEAIQLLRDAMFRLCESYAAGGLSQENYALMISKYQKSMVTLIAISQLTGAAIPSQLTLSSNSSIQLSNKAFEAKENLDQSRAELDTFKEARAKVVEQIQESETALTGSYEEKCPDGKATEGVEQKKCNAHAELIKSKAEQDLKVERLEKDVEEWKVTFDKANEATAITAHATASAINNPQRSVLDKDAILELGKVVQELVSDVFDDEMVTTCLDALKDVATTSFGEVKNLTELEKTSSTSREYLNRNSAQTKLLTLCEDIITLKIKSPNG